MLQLKVAMEDVIRRRLSCVDCPEDLPDVRADPFRDAVFDAAWCFIIIQGAVVGPRWLAYIYVGELRNREGQRYPVVMVAGFFSADVATSAWQIIARSGCLLRSTQCASQARSVNTSVQSFSRFFLYGIQSSSRRVSQLPI